MDKYSVETVAVNVDFELIVVRRFCLSQQVCKSFMLLDARIEAAFLVESSDGNPSYPVRPIALAEPD